ncbi:MAG: LamG domain-containing protein [Verrucomicrobia bacterium]|nr:LamG domain-containing protein [Verrucomicrobiota bacterium]
MALAVLLASQAALPAQTPTAGSAQALTTVRQVAKVAPNPDYRGRPLTVECRARLNTRQGYNILIAQEPKRSSTHWELFTAPGSGCLAAYLPGCEPNHLWTTTNVADGQWHEIALVLEEQRGRVFVDGALAVEHALTRQGGQPEAGPLVIGALESGDLGCDGNIQWVRLSNVAREIGPELATAPQADGATIGLWRFDDCNGERVPDLSARRADAVLVRTLNEYHETGIWPRTKHGGMSAALQPMPPARDASRERRLLAQTIADLDLKSVSAARFRDGVLRYWLTDYENWRSNIYAPGQLEYPQSRPRCWVNVTNVIAQTYDKQALVWDTDGGPLGTALRRTEALLGWLSKSHPDLDLAALSQDFARVKSQAAIAAPARGSAMEIALYLGTCALSRQIALQNPLLNFDDLLCVARG